MPLTSIPAFGAIPIPIDWNGWNGSNNTGFTSLTTPTPAFPLALAPMGSDRFALGYYDTDSFPKATAVTVSGDTITNGSLRTIDSNLATAFNRYQLQRLDDDKMAAFYAGNSGDVDQMHARILTGTSLSVGATEIALGTADRDENLIMVPMDTDKVLYIRSRGIATQNVFSQIRRNTSPTVFASGNFLTVASGSRAFYMHGVKLPTVDKAVVAFTLQSTQAFHLRVIENTTGDTTVQGTAITITDVPGTTDQIVNLLPIDSTHVALIYSGSGSGGRTYIRIYSISGTTLTEELSETVLLTEQLNNANSAQSTQGSSDYVQLTSNQFMIVNEVAGASETKAYIIQFPTATTVSVIATVTVSTSPHLNTLLAKVSDTSVLMVAANNSNVVQGKLLKL